MAHGVTCTEKTTNSILRDDPSCPPPPPSPTPTPVECPSPRPTPPPECRFAAWSSLFCKWTCICPPGSGPWDCEPGVQIWCDSKCRCVASQFACDGPSPIIVDISGNGFDLTDASHGVKFDLDSDGVKEQIAWTSPNTDNVWLVLDRNGNGLIDDGTES